MAQGLVKICGIKTAEDALTAALAGADLLGLVFVPKSPRAIAPDLASELVTEVKQRCLAEGLEVPRFVGLFVNAGEKLIAEAAPFLSHLQFHGAEDADRIREMRAEFGLEIIKAIGVSEPADFDGLDDLAKAADLLIFDARAPQGSDRTGGHGAAFDWRFLERYRHETPFLLAGGLRPETVEGAIAVAKSMAGFAGVDVSSGVEARLGVKDPGLMKAFIRAARNAF
jgi:phosphoribosylanthranilate isomerase